MAVINRQKKPTVDDARIERQIITGLIVSDKFCECIIPILKPNLNTYLQTSFAKTVARWCIDHRKKYKEPPRKFIEDIFRDKEVKLSEDHAELTKEFLHSLSEEYEERAEEFNAEPIIDKAKKYFSLVSLKNLKSEVDRALKGGDVDKGNKLISDYKRPDFTTNDDEIFGKGFTSRELQKKEITKIKWLVDNVIPFGLTLLAGKAKMGKSFFLLNVAIDLALGREAFDAIPTEHGRVLYLALESPVDEIKDRIDEIMKGEEWPDNLHIYPLGGWPRFDKGGFQALEKWAQKHPDTKLIIIDTWAKIKKPQQKAGYFYEEDYLAISQLQEFAGKYKVAVVVSHHTRKTRAEDCFDEILGSVGLQAGVDTMAILSRYGTGGRPERIYKIRGRNIAEGQVTFNARDFRWLLSEDTVTEYHEQSKQRKTIVRELEWLFMLANKQPVKRDKLINAVKGGVGKGVDTLIKKLMDKGQVERVRGEYGFYAPRGYTREMQGAEVSQKIRQHLNRKRRTGKKV